MNKPPYRCLYNHELLSIFTTETPYQTYRQPVADAQAIGVVQELRGTGVDAVMLCPQAWMTNLWPSKVDPRWQSADAGDDRLPEQDLKYYDKVYQRISRYMRQGKDPVALSVETARKIGIAPFFSYRMNENHYTQCADCPTHSAFWRDHPEYRLQKIDANLDYMHSEVRDHLFALICELLGRYDVDGFECDFMRQAVFFAPDKVAEGTEVMTEFVRRIRAKLDEIGRARGKTLFLCARVPHHLGSPPAATKDPNDFSRQRFGHAGALDVGLDVERWDREKLVDMVNVSSSFFTSQQVDISGYRQALGHATIYGELHYISQLGKLPGAMMNVHRLTNDEYYRTTALNFQEQGADGISLFNLEYSREHSFLDPRRRYYPGVEPPFGILPSLTRPEQLREGDQHICWIAGYGGSPTFPLAGNTDASFEVYVPDCFHRPFSRAVLRIEAEDRIAHLPILAEINGTATVSLVPNGELFQPPSLEALPDPLNLKQYAAPLEALRAGTNRIVVQNRWRGEGGSGYFRGRIRLQRVELALYR